MTNDTEERQSFPFYLSFEKGIQKLTDEDQLTVYRAISRFSLFGEEPKLEGFAAMAWSFIFPILEKSRKRFLAGKEGASFGKLGGAPKGNQNARKQPQKQPQKQPTDTYTYTDTNNNSNQRLESKNTKCILPPLAQKDYVFVMNLWNEVCTNLRSVQKLTSSIKGGKRSNRKRAISYTLNHIAQNYTEGKTLDEAKPILKEIFNKANRSNFLCGDNERGWRADFDWVMKPGNIAKVYEGNYNNSSQGKPQQTKCSDEWE